MPQGRESQIKEETY